MEVMDKLKQYIGKKIKCEYVFSRNMVTSEGILKEVYDYKTITVDDQIIPFVGIGSGIISLSCEDEILFQNPHMTTNYMGFGPELNTVARKTFGKDWIRLEEKNMAKLDPSYSDYHVTEDWFIEPSKSDEEVISYYNKFLQAYIVEGQAGIWDEQRKQEWKQLCESVVGNRKEIEILNATFAVMKFLREYLTPFDEMLSVVKDELQLSNETLNWAVMNASVYSPRGEELLLFWSQNNHSLDPVEESDLPKRR